MLITDTGTIIRTKIASINTYSRTAGGVTIMKVPENTVIVGFTPVAPEEEKDDSNSETEQINESSESPDSVSYENENVNVNADENSEDTAENTK